MARRAIFIETAHDFNDLLQPISITLDLYYHYYYLFSNKINMGSTQIFKPRIPEKTEDSAPEVGMWVLE